MSKLIRTEYDTGSITTFLAELFLPLSCENFVVAHNSKTKTYDIAVNAKNVEIFTTGVAEPKLVVKERRTLSIDFRHSLPVYALVPGGWVPPPFVEPPIFLFDRNVIRYIEQITKGNALDIYSDTKWWLDMIAADDVYISPFLYAFESGNQMIPDFDEFKCSYQEGVEIVRGLFPNAEVPEYRDKEYDAALEQWQTFSNFTFRKRNFCKGSLL